MFKAPRPWVLHSIWQQYNALGHQKGGQALFQLLQSAVTWPPSRVPAAHSAVSPVGNNQKISPDETVKNKIFFFFLPLYKMKDYKEKNLKTPNKNKVTF